MTDVSGFSTASLRLLLAAQERADGETAAEIKAELGRRAGA